MTSKKVREILKEVLKKIKPTLEQRKKLNSLSTTLLEAVNRESARFRGKAIVAGSLTRNTWLPTKNEFDIFIIFPKQMSEEDLEKYGLEIGKKVIEELGGSWRIEYAQHPYVRGEVEDVVVDIVPCYEVESGEKIQSAVDRTPFHVKYLEKKLPRALSDDVRLLKAFLKANGIYGADTKTEGFSGYICELLVINYGRFVDVLRIVNEWKPKEIIDIEKYWDEKDYKRLRKKYKDEILIIIDPVDKNRNTAAAISAENFYKFKKITKEFLREPRAEMFLPKEVEPLTQKELELQIEKRGTELLLVKFGKPDVVPDILWPQLRRATKRLEGIFREYEFKVHRSDCWSNEKDACAILLEMEISKLPLINEKIGPYVWKEENSKDFIKKYEGIAITGPYIRENTWRVEIKREWKSALGKLKDSLSDKEKILKEKGIPNYIASEIVEGFEILRNEKISNVLKNREFGMFLRKYFEKEKLGV
ncbi:MAG: CCA tRNA nucleotidyltransferase [Candidatus Aenigmarchaeota archaeon]|nr:CCA tRNA nucleotidyltransferase [Candidatus Aenigmarchaeota archaeon]